MKEDKIVMPELERTDAERPGYGFSVCDFFTCPDSGCDSCAVYSLENFKKYQEQQKQRTCKKVKPRPPVYDKVFSDGIEQLDKM